MTTPADPADPDSETATILQPPARTGWDDDDAIRKACLAGASEREVLLALGYAPESFSSRAKLASRSAELGVTVPRQRSPFENRALVLAALKEHANAIDVLRALNAAAGRKNYDRLDQLADELQVPRPHRRTARNQVEGTRHVRNADARQQLAEVEGDRIAAAVNGAPTHRQVLAEFGLPDTASNRRVLKDVLRREGLQPRPVKAPLPPARALPHRPSAAL